MQDESESCRAGSGAGYTPTACTLSDTGASFASVEGTSFWAPRVAFVTACAGTSRLHREQSQEPRVLPPSQNDWVPKVCLLNNNCSLFPGRFDLAARFLMPHDHNGRVGPPRCEECNATLHSDEYRWSSRYLCWECQMALDPCFLLEAPVRSGATGVAASVEKLSSESTA